MRLGPTFLLLALLPLLSSSPALAGSPPETVAAQIERAATAYDAGNCAEVLAAFGALSDPAEDLALDGLSLYRWGFCLAASRRGNPASQYEAAARVLGEETSSPAARLESYFYRVNALLNLDRATDAKAAAQLAIERWKAGSLTVPAGDPQAWFQLGKLFRDAGQPQGALEPYGRALDLHEKGPKKLRSAYVERIADLATDQKDFDLARRAGGLLGQTADSPAGAARNARMLLESGDFAGARQAFLAAARGGTDAAMDAQYAAEAVLRIQETIEGGDRPADSWNGTPLADLGLEDLRKALGETAREAWPLLDGRVVEVPRPKGPGTRPAPHPSAVQAYRPVRARFAGLLKDAIRRQAPLQEWAIRDGYQVLVHHGWDKVIVQRDAEARGNAIVR